MEKSTLLAEKLSCKRRKPWKTPPIRMDLAKVKYVLTYIAILDWIAAAVVLGAGYAICYAFGFPDDFEPYITSDISNPARTSTIPYPHLCAITFGVGAVITAAIWVSFSGLPLLPKALAAYYFALCLSLAACCFVKRLVLRPRPDTIAQCGGDGSYRQCLAVLSGEDLVDQFYSFPSGHAGESMGAAVFLALLLNHVWQSPTMIACALKMLPVLASVFIGVTRFVDRAHHADDVLAGWIIGVVCGYVTYRTFARSIPAQRGARASAVSESSVMSLSARGYI